MMRRLAIGLICVFPVLVFACDVTDDAGQKIHLSHPAERIISLAPDLTEMLFAAGAGSHLVGVMQGSDFPAAAKKIPVVASYNQLDSERILTLKPDLIVVWEEGALAQTLKRWDIPVYHSHQKKLTDIATTLQRLGCLAGTQKIADHSAAKFLQDYHYLQKKYSNRKPVTVFYQVWQQPLITVTKASWIHDAMTLCGGKNIFANLRGAAPEVNLEAVIVANPDVILGAASKQDWKAFWRRWPQLNAVKKNHLFTVNPDLIERASPRILAGVREMCQALDMTVLSTPQ